MTDEKNETAKQNKSERDESKTPQEPGDYDNPEQLAEYFKELRNILEED